MDTEYELTDTILKNLATAKIDHDHVQLSIPYEISKKTPINSIDFSDDGTWLVSSDDFALNVFDVTQGKRIKTLYNKIHKIDMVKFTHNKHAVICATKTDNKIHYWSIYENEIIKSFQGHDDAIICLELNPVSDLFLSSGKDQKFKLWDLGKNDQLPIAVVDLSPKNSIVIGNFDTAGVIFALAYTDTHSSETAINKIRLYDIDKISEGSFTCFKVECPEIRVLKFSNSGTDLLISTNENLIYILDAYDGTPKRKFTSYSNENSLTIEASFTPDSKFVISGSEDGKIVIWSLETGEEVTKLEGHLKPSLHVKFHPKNLLLVSACKLLIFWLPQNFSNTA